MSPALHRPRRAPAARAAVRVALGGAGLAVAAAAALAQDAAQPAAPAGEAPKKVEFLADGAIRRADGMVVRYYRVNHVQPEALRVELDTWKSSAAAIAVVAPGAPAYPKAPVASIAGTPPKTAPAEPVPTLLRIVETAENWPVLERVLEVLDVPQPQVRVEAKVVELTWDDETRLGVSAKLTKPVGSTFLQTIDARFPNTLDAVNGATATFNRTQKYLTFDYVVQAAASGVKAEVVSHPEVLASQGETAVIRAGDEEPFVVQTVSANVISTSTQFKPVGLRLEVQPLLVGRDMIRVRVWAEQSRVSDFRVTATAEDQQVVNAVISTRNADTVVTVPDGETIVIGGLQQTQSRDARTGLPLLKDIPVLGYAFGSTTKREQKTELFFWITLTIERPEEARLFVPPGEKARVREEP